MVSWIVVQLVAMFGSNLFLLTALVAVLSGSAFRGTLLKTGARVGHALSSSSDYESFASSIVGMRLQSEIEYQSLYRTSSHLLQSSRRAVDYLNPCQWITSLA